MAEEKNQSSISFSTLLASSVHDMKNSVGTLLLSLRNILSETPPQSAQQRAQFANLEYEAVRINNDLIQLLTLYRLDEKSIGVNIDEVRVMDVLEDQLARNENLLAAKNITCHLNCDKQLVWFLDAELIGSVINNLLANASRYAAKQINLNVGLYHQFLKIEISDDGDGFPEFMLEIVGESNDGLPLNQATGSTGLGLEFARRILVLHCSNKDQGYIRLTNQGIKGGGKVEIYIP